MDRNRAIEVLLALGADSSSSEDDEAYQDIAMIDQPNVGRYSFAGMMICTGIWTFIGIWENNSQSQSVDLLTHGLNFVTDTSEQRSDATWRKSSHCTPQMTSKVTSASADNLWSTLLSSSVGRWCASLT